jgi:hypothetical protein
MHAVNSPSIARSAMFTCMHTRACARGAHESLQETYVRVDVVHHAGSYVVLHAASCAAAGLGGS